ncbi:flagellar hook-associated protein FlgK [Candidatus Latescibacterota bacterium]
MSTLSYGLNIANNSLKTQSAILNIISHNIANAETPGYSRQTVLLSTVADESNRGLMARKLVSIGGGVLPKEISRARFALYDEIFRKENQDLNDYIKTEELMYQVELLFSEPTERGLSNAINEFFNGWQEVANDPHNMAARHSLRGFSIELTNRFHHIYNQLQTIREDIDLEISSIPDSINEITEEIANLNASIRIADSQKASSNDLRDKRDHLVDELSEIVNVRSVEQDNGTYTILIGGNVAVEQDYFSKLSSVTSIDKTLNVRKTIIISEEGDEYVPQHGKMGALIKFRDNNLNEIMNDINKIAEAIITSVNYEHSDGYGMKGGTDLNFFNPQNKKAFNISVSPDIDDVSKIAVSGDGAIGDNSNALRINDIRHAKIVDQRFSIGEYYNTMIANIGIMGRHAQSSRKNEELLVDQIDNAREGIKGVSVDEELVNMITCQRIYQSAARLVTVIDELLESVINLT